MNSSLLVMIMVATQIIAESFPISSSGHMLLVGKLATVLGLGRLPALPEFFDHFLHGPTIIVVIIYFWRAWSEPLGFLLTGCLDKNTRDSWRRLCMIFLKIVGFVSIADGITVLFYYLIKKQLATLVTLDSNSILLAGFIITTGLLVSLRFLKNGACTECDLRSCPSIPQDERQCSHDGFQGDTMGKDGARTELVEVQERAGYKTLSAPSAVLLGIVQGLTLLTGISRFASTYVIARWLGISHRRAFQVSFLLLFPLIIAGFFVTGLPHVFTSEIFREIFTIPMILVFTGATIIAFYALKLADYMGARQKLWWFGVYMLAPVTVTFMLLFLGR